MEATPLVVWLSASERIWRRLRRGSAQFLRVLSPAFVETRLFKLHFPCGGISRKIARCKSSPTHAAPAINLPVIRRDHSGSVEPWNRSGAKPTFPFNGPSLCRLTIRRFFARIAQSILSPSPVDMGNSTETRRGIRPSLNTRDDRLAVRCKRWLARARARWLSA